ncbi:MAG TPA: hypothetical protein VF592_03650 [Sphingomonas sp.]|jgi:hypothetical protein|uniref:hypothetical protein n=1 Tax=Sphingomonas sp. TaxID=28214 RepID=UPI002ED99ACA
MTLIVEGKSRRALAAHDDRAWLAWHIASLQRARRMPPLKSLTAKPKAKKKGPMGADAMLTMARMWSAVAGKGESTV